MLQFKNSIYFLIYFNQLYGNYNWTLYLSDILDDDIVMRYMNQSWKHNILDLARNQ